MRRLLHFSVLKQPEKAFATILAAQKQVQQGDNGVPLTIQVKTSKDRLYNNLVKLMKELGVKWFDPNLYAAPFLRKLCDCLWYNDDHQDASLVL